MTGNLILPGTGSSNLHAIHKGYVDANFASVAYVNSQVALSVLKAGSTMTGFLTLNADPDAPLKAATKQYVDNKISLGGAEISDTAPTAAQGKLWWESDAGGLWLSYNDGNSTQWIGVGGNVAQGNYVSKAGDTITGNISITATTPSGTPTNGALVVAGGVGVGGAVNIAGAVNHNSTTQLGAGLSLFYAAPAIVFDRPAIAGGNAIWGAVAGQNKWAISIGDTAALSGGNVGANFSIARFADTTGAWLGNSFEIKRDDGRVLLASTTASTSPTTGALTVNGGVGIGGDTFVNGAVIVGSSGIVSGNGTNTGAYYFGSAANGRYIALDTVAFNIVGKPVKITDTTASTSPTTGALTVAGGVGVVGDLNVAFTVTSRIIAGNYGIKLQPSSGTSTGWGAVVLTDGTLDIDELGVAQRFQIAPGGAVKIPSNIASTSPTTGGLVVTGGLGISGQLYVGALTGFTHGQMGVGYNGAVQSGGVLVSNNSDASATLQNVMVFYRSGIALGSIDHTNTTTSYRTTSDARLKDDMKTFDAGEIIDKTNAYDFKWKSSGERAHGIIAQEAIEIYPEAIRYDEREDWWGVDYSKYVPVMLQELKSLRSRVAELEVR